MKSNDLNGNASATCHLQTACARNSPPRFALRRFILLGLISGSLAAGTAQTTAQNSFQPIRDDKGNEIGQREVNNDGKAIRDSTHTTDSHGNKVETTMKYEPPGVPKSEDGEIRDKDTGKLLEKWHWDLDKDGNPVSGTVKEYHPNGKVKMELTFGQAPNYPTAVRKVRTTYDEQGRETEVFNYGSLTRQRFEYSDKKSTTPSRTIDEHYEPGEKGQKGEWKPGLVKTEKVSHDSFGSLIAMGEIKLDTSGTGETIGHIADLTIENLTDEPLYCVVPPIILESRSRRNQHYACIKEHIVRIDPHSHVTVPMDGVCLDRNKPPVSRETHGDLIVNEGNPTVPQDPESHLHSRDAGKLLRIAKSKYDAADKLQKDGLLKDIPYKDKQKQKDIVVQWSTWTDPEISKITGSPPATKEDLKKVVYKQIEEQGPVPPEKKKKIDQGIDTIFEKIELTTKKAKELEKPDPFVGIELTGKEAKGGRPPETVGMPTPVPGTMERPSATPTPESTPTGGTEEKKDKPPEKTVSKPLEKPCPGGKLLVRHAYSECGPDGFWHVVEDAYYDCPPVKSFRVFDFQTDQKCTAGQAPPTGLVGPAYKEFEGGSSDCQSPKPTDEFIFVSECVGGFWATKTYRIYECLDGSKRIKSPPEKLVQSTTECTKPPPAPPH